MIAYLALGSNLGSRRTFLKAAVSQLEHHGAGTLRSSRLYETDPVGGPQDQGAYLNLVVSLECELSPEELLELCQGLEAEAGRERTVHWGPRTLDVDLLIYGDVAMDTEQLTLPHPRMWQRRFVLEPLRDLAPELLVDDWESGLEPGKVWPVEDL